MSRGDGPDADRGHDAATGGHPERRKKPSLGTGRELSFFGIVAIGGGVYADSLIGDSGRHPMVNLTLALAFAVIASVVLYYAQHRRDPAWTVGAFLRSDSISLILACGFIGYLVVADPIALAV